MSPPNHSLLLDSFCRSGWNGTRGVTQIRGFGSMRHFDHRNTCVCADINHSAQKALLTRSSWHQEVLRRYVPATCTCILIVNIKGAACHERSLGCHSHFNAPGSTGAMVQLRGSFRKLGDTKPTKDQCLHLHLVGTVLGLTHLQKKMQNGHAKLLSRFHYTPLHPAESTAQRPQHTYMYILLLCTNSTYLAEIRSLQRFTRRSRCGAASRN